AFKTNLVRRNLERIGGFSDIPMEPIIGMENPWRYRNKAQYPVGVVKDQLAAGYYAARSHELLEVRDCLLSPVHNAKILETILAFAGEFGILAYDEATGKGLLRHILIREAFATGEVLICLVINGRKLPHAEELVRRLLEQNLEIRSICLNINTNRTNVILGGEVLPLYGEPWITDRLGDFEFRISPLSFYQVNPVQTLRLYETAVEFAGLTGEETVFDLFCGIGTISHFLAKRAKEVYGVEIVPEAIRDAKANAARNHLTNVHFFAAAAEEVAARGKFDEETPLVSPNVVVLDPPRKGCEESLLRTIRQLAPDRIVYVSCDSATLARDCKILAAPPENGEASYSLSRVRPCDMFPQTSHVESVVKLTRAGL
ncbi:MAG: 23S rRNA (uracil(1939)-C(5))-methyltransferase RlmD, partial [Lachnospiraceae bacterium]